MLPKKCVPRRCVDVCMYVARLAVVCILSVRHTESEREIEYLCVCLCVCTRFLDSPSTWFGVS